jgi:hypothetical protein
VLPWTRLFYSKAACAAPYYSCVQYLDMPGLQQPVLPPGRVCSTAACAAPGRVFSTAACSALELASCTVVCAAPGRVFVSVLQLSVLPPEVSAAA